MILNVENAVFKKVKINFVITYLVLNKHLQ